MIRIWGRRTSARSLKAFWALAEASVPYALIPASATMGPAGSAARGHTPYGVVDTDEYRAMNPNGTVPTIDDDGFVLWESNAIVRYVAMQYAPDLLYGGSIKTFAAASRWLDWENNMLIPGQHALAQQLYRLPESARDLEILERARKDQIEKFAIVDAQLSLGGFMEGSRFTLADIPIGIRVHRWKLFGLEGPPTPHIDRWYAEIVARPAFRTEVSDPDNHRAG